jgi:hypothetical protein
MSEDRQDLVWDLIGMVAATAVFTLLSGPLLWLAGRMAFLAPLARGGAVLLIGVLASGVLVGALERAFGLDIHRRAKAYVGLNLLAGGALTVWWSIHAARLAGVAASAATPWQSTAVHVAGLLSVPVAATVVSVVYRGTVYRLTNLLLGLGTYLALAAWRLVG